ncbi:MAG: T9SS type A sorting domain-containing protein [Bacteroidota bacterium]|jgi:acyl-CoA thioesterase-1
MHHTNVNTLTLFPNPSMGELNLILDLSDEEKVQIEVYDLSGRNVQTLNMGRLTSGKHYLKLDTSEYRQGVYLIKSFTEKKTIANHKFIKL